MISGAERVGSTGENAQTGAEKHPLEDMPSFEDHMRQMESSELDSPSLEQLNESDKTIDNLFDRLGRGAGEGYFEDPDELLALTQDAISQTPQQAINNFKSQVDGYKARSTENYQIRAATFYEQTKDNVQRLAREHQVGNDTIKVFLNPDFISSVGRGRSMSEYNAIQSDYSRREGYSWMTGLQTSERYMMRTKMVADSLSENVGDVAYQSDDPDSDTTYDPSKPIVAGQFIHVNSKKPREKGGLRCYITPDKTTDPSAVLYAWNESFQNSPLKDSLYFKFATSMKNYKDGQVQRPDDIVIYKTDIIDDEQFKALLQDFQKRCNEMSPDILPSDGKKMPATTQKIANGISIAGEPGYVNDYLRYTDHKEGKHSWTTFVDKMAILSTSIAANRLGVRPDSADVPGLQDETKKVFREFMLLSKINPDTMLPEEYGDKRPSWANLDDVANSDVSEMTENKEEKAVVAEEAVENKTIEQAAETTTEDIVNKKQVASGDVSSIYSVEKADGKTSTVVESQYFDMAEKFTKAHDELKNDFDLKLAMSGMSTDLALIDATHGRNFTNGDEKTRASLLEDYSTLRARLDNPDTPPEEKQLITDYFDTMSGNALSFLESRYDPNLAKKDQAEKQEDGETKEKFNRALTETKEELKKIKRSFSKDLGLFDSALVHINELVDNRSTDLDELNSSLTKLLQAQESLAQSAGKFNEANANYLTDIVQGEEQLGEESYRQEFSNVENNNEQIQSASKKVRNVEDRISEIKLYISKVEDLMDTMRRF